MTLNNLDALKLNLRWFYSDIAHQMVKKMEIFSPSDELLYKLLALKGYCKILDEYTLCTIDEEDINFFDRDIMGYFLFKINELLNTDFKADFIKE